MILPPEPYVDESGVVHDNLEVRRSDRNKKLLQIETGRKYDAPVDVKPCRYTYEETDEPIELSDPTNEEYV